MRFRFEHRIQTLAKNACAPSYSSFEQDGIRYSQWDFNHRDGWIGDAWLAEGEVEAECFTKAINEFVSKLLKATRRISFISQSYTEAWSQPWLGTRDDSQVGFFRYTNEVSGGGLMFMEKDQTTLELLTKDNFVPEEFFYYWNDAVITFGYSAKLLLMLSALEALVKKPGKKNDYKKLEEILGEKLKVDLFGVPGDSDGALRHRLVHGEYFSGPDAGTNYLEQIHRAVLSYFNAEVLKKDLLQLDVVNPQRHFFGNRKECRIYLKAKPGHQLNLKSVLTEFGEKGIHEYEKYDPIWDKTEQQDFLGETLLF